MIKYKTLCSLTWIGVCLIIGPKITYAQSHTNEGKLLELGEAWLVGIEIERKRARVAETAWWTTQAIRLDAEARRIEELEVALTTLDSELKKIANTKLGFFDYLIGIVADALEDADGVSDWNFVEYVERFEFAKMVTSAIQTEFELTWDGRLKNEKIQLQEELLALREKLGLHENWNPLLDEIPPEAIASVIAQKIDLATLAHVNKSQSQARQVTIRTKKFQQKLQSEIVKIREVVGAEMHRLIDSHQSTLSEEDKERRHEIIALAATEVGLSLPKRGLLYDADMLVRESLRKFAVIAEEEGFESKWLPTDAVLVSFAEGATLLARGAELLGYIEQGFWANPLPTLGAEWVELAEAVEERAKRVEQIVEWLAEREAVEVEQEVAMILRVERIANEARRAEIDNAGLVAKQAESMQLLLEGRAKREEIEAARWASLLEEASSLATEAKWLAIEGKRLVERETYIKSVRPMEGRSNLDRQAGRLGVRASRIAEQVILLKN